LTKSPKFAADFFNRYIYGTEKNNYEALLAKAGLVLRKAQPGKAWAGPLSAAPGRGRAGQARANGSEGLPIQSSTIIGTPIYKAGLDAGDVIMKADGKDIKDAQAFNDIIDGRKPGDTIAVNYHNRTGDHQTTITLEESPYLEVVTNEKAGKTLSKDQEAFRDNWLSSKIK
ncbi:MAG: S1C family serine protease, partial [Bacteroidota bacterium]|nr:S1C family serine protease [Bacteroidota bacterium]